MYPFASFVQLLTAAPRPHAPDRKPEKHRTAAFAGYWYCAGSCGLCDLPCGRRFLFLPRRSYRRHPQNLQRTHTPAFQRESAVSHSQARMFSLSDRAYRHEAVLLQHLFSPFLSACSLRRSARRIPACVSSVTCAASSVPFRFCFGIVRRLRLSVHPSSFRASGRCRRFAAVVLAKVFPHGSCGIGRRGPCHHDCEHSGQ